MMASYDYKNPAAIKRLVAGGAQLRPFSQEILSACFEAAIATYAEISASNADVQEDLRRSAAFKKDAYLWAQLSEYTYDTLHDDPAAQRQALIGSADSTRKAPERAAGRFLVSGRRGRRSLS